MFGSGWVDLSGVVAESIKKQEAAAKAARKSGSKTKPDTKRPPKKSAAAPKSSRKAPKKTPATPRNLGLVKIIQEHLEGITLPAAIPQDHTKALETLGSFLVDLDKQFKVGRIDIFERQKRR